MARLQEKVAASLTDSRPAISHAEVERRTAVRLDELCLRRRQCGVHSASPDQHHSVHRFSGGISARTLFGSLTELLQPRFFQHQPEHCEHPQKRMCSTKKPVTTGLNTWNTRRPIVSQSQIRVFLTETSAFIATFQFQIEKNIYTKILCQLLGLLHMSHRLFIL